MINSDLVAKIPIFSDLPKEDIQKIAEITVEKSYRKNSVIFMEGEPGEAVCFIKSGKVKIFRDYEDGREHIVNICGPGDIFGEATLFSGAAYPASASVYEDADIGMIRNRDLEELIGRNADLALRIIKLMAKKLVFAQYKIRDLTYNDVFSRTASQLFKLSEDHSLNTPSGSLINIPLSRQELADMVGTTRETISRVMSRFKKEGAVSEEKDRIIITNKDRLRSWI